MRHDDERSRTDNFLDRFDQLPVEILQMMLRGGKQHGPVLLNVSRLQVEFRELECQAFQRGSELESGREIPGHLEVVAANQKRMEAVADSVVRSEERRV